MRPSIAHVAQLRREARERGEVYRTPAEQRRRETYRSTRVLPNVHYDVTSGKLHRCPVCDSHAVTPDPAGPAGRWICTACPWYGHVPRPQARSVLP